MFIFTTQNSIRLIKNLLLIIGISITVNATAQRSEYSNVNFSAGLCGLVYLGDLTPSLYGDLNHANAGLQVAARIPLNRHLSLRGNYLTGSLNGDDDRHDGWRMKRSFGFTSNIHQVAAMLQWEFAGNSWEYDEDDRYTRSYKVKKYKILSPYFFAGLGYLQNNVTRDLQGIDSVFFIGDIAWENYYKEANTVYKSGMLVAPVGIGTHITLGSQVRLYVEYCYHAIFNDNLDGFGVAVFSAKPDAFHNLTFGLDFRFNRYGTRDRKEICNLNL
ncbi:hypothetical protein CAP35_07205 [Chitinophagaceae bacterium IBVUCB1]|nr:hypothetical protein CAP35_07205 [Chitinophagaceae bacterium IBVUCB1]